MAKKQSVKIEYHAPEDRVLREGMSLAWVQGCPQRGITIERDDSNWVLALRWDGQTLSRSHLPGDGVWTVLDVMQSLYYRCMVDQLLAWSREQERKSGGAQAAAPATDPSSSPASSSCSRWAVALSALALVVSLGAGGIGLYALKVGLSAHVNQAVAVSQSTSSPTNAQALGAMPTRLNPQTLSPLGLALLGEAVAASGFSLNDNGQMVVVFSDPLCPACKEFEQWIAQDNYQTFSPLVVPVSLRPGSQEVAAAVLCSDNQAAKWADAIADRLIGRADEVCPDGLNAIARNNEIFRQLGFTHTPTFVAMNGAYMVGYKTPDEMLEWAKANDSGAVGDSGKP